jgi:hypothetical protein
MTKKASILLCVSFTSIVFLAGCGNSSSDTGSKNMVCAFVEGYLDNKAFALQDLAEGGSAKDAIESLLGALSREFESDLESKVLFADFFEAMKTWGASVDLAVPQGDSDEITKAAIALEIKMDEISKACESFGWKFEEGWRL